jgi:hypothetical protein
VLRRISLLVTLHSNEPNTYACCVIPHLTLLPSLQN